MTKLAAVLIALWLAAPQAAAARAPEPLKPLDLDRFMGRWYEILRTPNGAQNNCFAAHQVWSRKGQGRFSIAQTCHRGSPRGEARVVDTSAKLVDPASTAKFEASFFGGIIKRQYWVLDRADDYSWMIASTSNGSHVSLLSRQSGLSKGEETEFRRRIAAMGLDAAKLVAVAELKSP
jgi:apolipoprotein D and lipocalin family protein